MSTECQIPTSQDNEQKSEQIQKNLDSPQAKLEQLAHQPVVDEDPNVSIQDVMRIHLRVATIESAEAIPKSKKLLKLMVDVGERGKRQILSGISQFYSPESLIGRKIVIVANLQPAKFMGLESQGMLLAAQSEDKSKLILVDPGQELEAGSQVS